MKPLERIRFLEAIATKLQHDFTTTDINGLLRSVGLTDGLQDQVSSKRVYAKEMLVGSKTTF